MEIRFENKVAFITGAAGGIGYAAARMFAEAGASVVMADLDSRVTDRAKELEAEGHNAIGIRCDVSDEAQVKAAVEKGEMYNVRDLAITLKTLFEARNFLHRFEAAQIYYTQCYDNQSRASRKHQMNVKTARLYISHFIQVLNLAVLRDEIKVAHKELYGLPASNTVPDLLSEASLVEWGKKIIEGEQLRTTQGGIPIYNPTIARVKVHYDIFLESYERQKNYQALTNRSLDELASMRDRADELILDIWNQVEAKYQDVTPNDTRLEKCRDYGLIYYYRSSEKIKEEKEISC